MEKERLLKLINEGESETLELKTSLSEWKEALKTLVAFSWAQGGKILFGVSKSGKIIGAEIGKGTIENTANDIKQNTDPRLYPKITTLKIEGKNILLVETEKISDEPVLAFGRAFKRVGRSTHRLSREEYKRTILERHEQEFDSQLCKGAILDDINWNFVKEFFIPRHESLTERRMMGGDKELLEALECIKSNKPTNAGILLFGKNPQKFFMNSYIALARYKGMDVGVERLDYKEFSGNIFQQIDNCDRYIKEHIAIMSRLHPYRVEREDIPEYPLFSIRELVVNAVCHRDHSEQRTKVIVKMFDDHIEYYNPGGLPEEITPENITKKQFSRNPTIAKVLSKIRYIEELGEGWDKIMEEHKKHPLRPQMPRIDADRYTVTVTLFSTKEKFEQEKIIELNERQKQAVEYLRKHRRITNRDYRRLFPGISPETARLDLKNLIEKGIIEKQGIKKGAYYILGSNAS
ncbi:MAG: ATP-binding protein [Candidatus Altiarchaeota archaeon]|nr:ATP-binding protein [Candidatus Altiarchaeota archaeon]